MEHDTMPVPRVSEKTRLKHYAKHLRGEIRKAKALIKQQAAVRNLETELAELHQRAKQSDPYAR